jgi:sodium pump decarboxylase gamma subunit
VPTLIFGLQVTILGISVVFIALVFLIFVIKLLTKATELSEAKKGAGEPVLIKKGSVVKDAPLSKEDEGEVIAVIAAAVACLTKGKKMSIKTIQRVKEEEVPVWSAVGRQEIMFLRQTR